MKLQNDNIREWITMKRPDDNAGLRVEIVRDLLDEFEARGAKLTRQEATMKAMENILEALNPHWKVFVAKEIEKLADAGEVS